MPGLQPVYYRASDDSQPVPVFLEALADPVAWAILDQHIERLGTLTRDRPWLPEPQCERVSGELWELRCDVRTNGSVSEIGILYAVHGIYAILLHSYSATGRNRPPDAAAIAAERFADFIGRLGSNPSPYGDWAP